MRKKTLGPTFSAPQFVAALERLCRERGITVSTALEQSGMARSNYTRWKGGAVPSRQAVQRLADSLCVEVTDLTGQWQKPAADKALEHEERLFLHAFRRMNAAGRAEALKRLLEMERLEEYQNTGRRK